MASTEQPQLERNRRDKISFWIQMAGATAALALLIITAFIFLTSSSRTNQFVQILLQQIHDDTTRAHDEIICIISVPFEERTPDFIAECRGE